MEHRELKGVCKNCLGCNRLDNPCFEGVYRCKYATERQMDIEDLRRELKRNDNR